MDPLTPFKAKELAGEIIEDLQRIGTDYTKLRRKLYRFDVGEGWRHFGFESFNQWARKTLPYDVSHMHRLLKAGGVEAELQGQFEGLDLTPVPDKALELVARLPSEKRADAWEHVVEECGSRAPDIKTVQAVVSKINAEVPKPEPDMVRCPRCAGKGKLPKGSRASISWHQWGSWDGITEKDLARWREAYPAVNVERQLKAMDDWIRANPSKKKSNWARFITAWLSRRQDQGGDMDNGDSGGSPFDD